MHLSTDFEPFINDLGIPKWGYTEEDSSVSYHHFLNWITEGHYTPLNYLVGKRADLREKLSFYFKNFQSALVFLHPYPKSTPSSNGLKVADYALGFGGVDYHFVLKEKLMLIDQRLKKNNPDLETAFSLDIYPILERDLAYRSGLGWIGKNSMLLNKKWGSRVMISSILLSDKIQNSKNINYEQDHCGTCTRCIDACPTDAIHPTARTLNAQKCISTFTIELFKDGAKPVGFDQNQSEIFGCDICQDVCPWNQELPSLNVDESTATKNLISQFFLERKISDIIHDLENMSNRKFKKIFQATPMARTGRLGVLKNITRLI